MENTKEIVAKFEGRINVEVKRQEKLDKTKEQDFRREKLLEKYTVKVFYR